MVVMVDQETRLHFFIKVGLDIDLVLRIDTFDIIHEAVSLKPVKERNIISDLVKSFDPFGLILS